MSKYLIPKGYAGMALYPFIIVNDNALKKNKIFINHEKIHLRQQAELLILPFYVWYAVEYFIRLLLYKNHRAAYRNISFEREAYAHQSEATYLENRPLWSFIKFIR